MVIVGSRWLLLIHSDCSFHNFFMTRVRNFKFVRDSVNPEQHDTKHCGIYALLAIKIRSATTTDATFKTSNIFESYKYNKFDISSLSRYMIVLFWNTVEPSNINRGPPSPSTAALSHEPHVNTKKSQQHRSHNGQHYGQNVSSTVQFSHPTTS